MSHFGLPPLLKLGWAGKWGICMMGLGLGWLNMVGAETATTRSLKDGEMGKPAEETGETATREQLEEQLRVLRENLILTKAESDLFRQQWQDLRLRNEALGIDALTVDEKKLQEKVVQAFKQAYQAERERRQLVELLEQLLKTSQALLKAGSQPHAEVRAEYEAALRAAQDFLGGKRKGEIPLGQDLGHGQVIDINSDLGVVVINLGRAQGVQPGMPFRVWQEDREVGRVKAYQVREQISAALVESVEKGKQLRAGDRVAVAAEK